MEKTLWLAAFDIGKKNFAFVVQEFRVARLEELKRRSNSTDLSWNDLSECLFSSGTIKLIENLNLTGGCEKKYLDPKTFFNMTEELDKFSTYWERCSIFLVEQQMSFGKKRNTMALKLGQHCFSYFCIKHPTKKIIEFPSYHKTQVLKAPKKFGMLTKKFKNGKTKQVKDNHKKWSIRECRKILTKKGDDNILTKFEALRKKDDVSDCLLMIQAYILMDLEK